MATNPYAKGRPEKPTEPIDAHNPPRHVKEVTLRASLIGALLHANPNITFNEAVRHTVANALGKPPLAAVISDESPILTKGKEMEHLAIADLSLKLRRDITHSGPEQKRLHAWHDGIHLSATPDGRTVPQEPKEKPALIEVKYPFRQDKESIADSPTLLPSGADTDAGCPRERHRRRSDLLL